MKSVQIRSYFWSVFCCIRTEYGDLNSVPSPNKGKYGPEITPYLDTFHAVRNLIIKVVLLRLRKFLPNENFPQPCLKKYHHFFVWCLKLKINEF